ncbi:MAG TPA: hypothetical protein VF905_12055 [Nitrospirota bacterium]
MIRRLARAALLGLLKDNTEIQFDAADNTTDSKRDNSSQEAKIADLQRRVDAYFIKIEGVLRERDRWNQMFFQQSREHLAAQDAMEVEIMRMRTMVLQLVGMVNEERKPSGKALLEPPFKELMDLPIGLAEQFRRSCEKLLEERPIEIDHLAERDAIARS